MDFRCVCGQVLSAEVAPGTVVKCPACGQMIRVPGAAPQTAQPPAGPTEQRIGAPVMPPAAGYGYAAAPGPRPYAPTYEQYAPPRTSGLAVAAMVLGLLSIIFLALTGIPAAIMGGVAIAKVRKSRGTVQGTGMAIAGLVLGIVFTLLTALPIAIIIPAVHRARRYAVMASCSSNLRQFGIAVTDYAIEQDDKMPPGDLNTFSYLAPYLGERNDLPGGGEVFRCPNHAWLPATKRNLYASYVFNVCEDQAENDQMSPFSVAGTNRLRRLGGVAPDTVLVIEMWTKPAPDGKPPLELRLNEPDRSPIEAGAVPITSYESRTPATFDPRGRLIDPGPYRFLDCYKGTNTPVSEMYHFGRINVLYADGSVVQEDIRQFTSRGPANERRWTRVRD